MTTATKAAAQIEFPAYLAGTVTFARPDELGQIGVGQTLTPGEQAKGGVLYVLPGHGLQVGDAVRADRYHATVGRVGRARKVRVMTGGACDHEVREVVPIHLDGVRWV